jgi:hypothetical protein
VIFEFELLSNSWQFMANQAGVTEAKKRPQVLDPKVQRSTVPRVSAGCSLAPHAQGVVQVSQRPTPSRGKCKWLTKVDEVRVQQVTQYVFRLQLSVNNLLL